MNDESAFKLFEEIEARLALLKAMFGTPTVVGTHALRAKKGAKLKTGTKRSGSTEPIKKLIKDGLFNTPKSAPEVRADLTRRALKFDKNDVAVTLMRLVRKDFLERVGGDGTSKNPWLYKKT